MVVIDRRFLKKGADIVIFRAGGLLATFASSIITARRLGPERIGYTGFVIVTVSWIVLLVTMNGDAALIRDLRAIQGPRRAAVVYGVFKLRGQLACLCALLWVMLAVCLGIEWRLVLGGSLLLLGLGLSPNWMLQSIEDVGGQMRMLFIQGVLGMLLTLYLVDTGSPVGVDCLIAGTCLVLSAIYGWTRAFMRARALWRGLAMQSSDRVQYINYAKGCRWLFISGLLTYAYTTLEQPLIGMIAGVEELGIYRSGVQVMNAVAAFTGIVPMVLYPKLVDWAKEPNYWSKCVVLSKVILGTSLLPLIILELGTWLAFERIYGNIFSEGRLCAAILIVSKFVVMWNVPFVWGLRACNKDRQVTQIILIAAVLSFGFNMLLIRYKGGVGAAFVNLASEVLVLIMTYVVARSSLRPNSDA